MTIETLSQEKVSLIAACTRWDHATCMECGDTFSTQAEADQHEQLFDHMVLGYFDARLPN